MLFDCPTYQREQTHTRHPIHHYTCLDMMAMRSDLLLFQKEDSPTHPREQLTLTLKQDCWDIPHPTRSIKRTTCRKNKCIFSSVNFIDGAIEVISRKRVLQSQTLCVLKNSVLPRQVPIYLPQQPRHTHTKESPEDGLSPETCLKVGQKEHPREPHLDSHMIEALLTNPTHRTSQVP